MAEDPDNPPQDDPPPPNPPANTPTPQETITDLQRRLDEATGSTAAALTTTRAALRTANPHLPDAVFEADNIDALTASVESHNATAEHLRTHPVTPSVNPAGGSTRKIEIPENLRGARRIAHALSHPGPGMTE